MATQKRQKRSFSGLSYRAIQRSNTTRKSQLPQEQQTWLKENSYKNVGWDNVIKLYQKIEQLIAPSEADEPSLEDLFLQADRIGQKYQTDAEIAAFNQQLSAEVNAISDMVDQQFPEVELEVVDYSTNRSAPKKKPGLRRRR
ncbi:hypothetical protein [Almyronema epifaneia]|uniref:Uncharacterized protein n=1 Tax=Almyronema epifaneia S1 TaxID=2991925 RepID=A0ABW6IK78_9CYAN